MNYNPYRSRERHRRAKPREGMTAADALKCAGIMLVTILILWAGAMI